MPGHGSALPRGLSGTSKSPTEMGKFGRMFRWLDPAFQPGSPHDEIEIAELLRQLGALMVSDKFNQRAERGAITPDADLETPERDDENRKVPAGYTYLGQFVDHDITFDPASSLQQQNDPDALDDFRTPRLDLDSVYGRGPDDQPYLYEKSDRGRLRVGPDRGLKGMNRPDLPRVTGTDATDDGSRDFTAVIGDSRNDENKIVSQIHTLFLRFHNKVYQDIAPRFPGAGQTAARFREAQRIVRWCYQWIVLRDFLPRICRADVLERILPGLPGGAPRLQYYHARSGQAFIPVEFSAAAYRFGHSMVRPSYALNDVAKSTARFTSKKGRTMSFARIPILVARPKDARDSMNGSGQPLPDSWGIDWSFFFGQIPAATPGTKQVPQPSYRIDTTLVDPLAALAEFAGESGDVPPLASLSFRNLLRGFRMGLPSGQDVARMMALPPLSEESLWQTRRKGDSIVPWPEGSKLLQKHRQWLDGSAPLWFYILKEAEMLGEGRRLGPVGSTIVAETLIALIWLDHFSFLFQAPSWTPEDEGIAGLGASLDMLGLTRYVG